ncbi:MAG: hypothetical protein FVQ79_09065 [Planctomycetes bacterium]|nr:hypothetical protein [Planctomycetota bacterium]
MMKKNIEEIALEDGRFDVKAFRFVFEGLGRTVDKLKGESVEGEGRHITGAELAEGLGGLASERWGRLAMMVLGLWGVSTTRDFGDIVYLMISHEWMSSTEGDTVEDFDDVFDFEEVFETKYRFRSV